jgi:carbon monoxide dehydrogenase subunit G
MPSQTFTGAATANASIDSVWEALNQAATWEAINGVEDVFDEQRESAGRLVGFKFRSTAAGKQYVGTATPGPRVEGKTLAWNIATSEIQGTIRVDLEADGPGTRIDVDMHVASVSMLARFGFPIIASVIGKGFQETVEDFASRLGSPGPPSDLG